MRYLVVSPVLVPESYSQVQHPAAKMIVMASQQQEQESGDGTNFVIAFAGALVEQAEELLRLVIQHALSVSLSVSISPFPLPPYL